MNKSIIDWAKQAIVVEQEAVANLVSQVDEQFAEAVQAMYQCKGRIIASGIGKSAIVAQKIAATLNSTGTPSFFLHAAEATHGDLGMIQSGDIVMILSKSGESAEIKVLASLVRNLGNKVIAVTGNAQSYLAGQSDFVINSFVQKEACRNSLAPTASTTAQMVLGDAIAVCLMELRDFSAADFARLHPGGNLGKRLYLKIADIYKHNAVPKVLLVTDLKNIILEISKGRVGATAVVDEKDVLTGIITDGDIRRLLEKDDKLSGIVAKDILSPAPKTVSPGTLAIEALELIKQFDLNQLIVTDTAHHVLGFVHLHDLIREGIY